MKNTKRNLTPKELKMIERRKARIGKQKIQLMLMASHD